MSPRLTPVSSHIGCVALGTQQPEETKLAIGSDYDREHFAMALSPSAQLHVFSYTKTVTSDKRSTPGARAQPTAQAPTTIALHKAKPNTAARTGTTLVQGDTYLCLPGMA